VTEPDELTEAEEAPPAGEEIHLPGPTFLPLFMAVGITLGVIGITINVIISIVGIAIFLITLVRWIRQTRRDISELPLEHQQSR
jgi:Flp pilus assembly protein TadB